MCDLKCEIRSRLVALARYLQMRSTSQCAVSSSCLAVPPLPTLLGAASSALASHRRRVCFLGDFTLLSTSSCARAQLTVSCVRVHMFKALRSARGIRARYACSGRKSSSVKRKKKSSCLIVISANWRIEMPKAPPPCSTKITHRHHTPDYTAYVPGILCL